MVTGRVIGNVWSTRRLEAVPSGAFLEIALEGSDARIVAFDVLGTGLGERVLVARGSAAAAWFQGSAPPIDALVIGSVDEPEGVNGASDPGVSATATTRSGDDGNRHQRSG